MTRLVSFGSGYLHARWLLAFHIGLILLPWTFSQGRLWLGLGTYLLWSGLGASLYLHRYLSHKSWSCPRWLEYFAGIFSTLSLVGSTLTWVAIHRAHHRYVDTPKDPHSPIYVPISRIHFFTMLQKPQLRFAKELIADPFHRFLHRYYWLIVASYFLILWMIGGFGLALWGHALPAVLVWQAGCSLNSLGHLWGSQAFCGRDQSRNNLLLSLIFWGEGWHNNHHAYPSRSNYSLKWYQIDLGGLLVDSIEYFRGLISSDKRKRPHMASGLDSALKPVPSSSEIKLSKKRRLLSP